MAKSQCLVRSLLKDRTKWVALRIAKLRMSEAVFAYVRIGKVRFGNLSLSKFSKVNGLR